jgi:riboflavin kinase/FMN adenylyltransferase
MQLIEKLSQADLPQPSLVTVGSYDGIHIGHQYLLKKMRAAAHSEGLCSSVVTFYPRPKVMLGVHPPDLYLTTRAQKAQILENLGIDLTAILKFNHELAQTPAADFVADLVDTLGMQQLWIGPDFALGRNRAGDARSLRDLGPKMGFEVHVIEPLVLDGELVSSTRIRQMLMQARIRQATALLGRYFSLVGTVVRGDQRGRRVGFPTANITVPSDLVVPPNGVYACFVWLDGQKFPAVTNIGLRPTFGGVSRTVEAYVLNFNKDLYGRELTMDIVDYLRPEVHFDSLDTLAAQIRVDVERASSLLAQEIVQNPQE